MAAADSIGTTFQAAMTDDEEMYTWLSACASPTNLNPNWGASRPYRIVAYCNAPGGYSPSDFHLVTVYLGGVSGLNAHDFEVKMSEYLGESYAPLKFKKPRYLDQWIICIDTSGKLSVWAGGGVGVSDAWIAGDGHIYNKTSKAYMLWPKCDSAYKMLNSPNQATW